ncbi:hypothetical protein M2E15_0698 [Bacillus mycoides]|nr:hypothetical protein M2E15_0698 [Bacillus mycoides]
MRLYRRFFEYIDLPKKINYKKEGAVWNSLLFFHSFYFLK